MAHFVQLTALQGDKVLINLDRIWLITSEPQVGSCLHLNQEEFLLVKEPQSEIIHLPPLAIVT